MVKLFFIIGFINVMSVLGNTPNWIIESGPIDPINYYGITLANGIMGLVSSSEPMQVRDVILNGIYDSYGRGRVSNIVKGFNPVNIALKVEGQLIGQKDISNYHQMLDMKRAVLVTAFDIDDRLTVEHSLRALRHLPHTVLMTLKITAKQDLEITPMSIIQAPDHLVDVRNFYSHIDRPHAKVCLLTSFGLTPSGKHAIAASNGFVFSEEHNQEPYLIHEDSAYNKHWVKFNKSLKSGETYAFSVVSSSISTVQCRDPLNEAERLSVFAALEGTERLIKRHETEWDTLWENDIVIEGDPQIQKDIHLALYHLYSFIREGTTYSIPPMGLSGLGYNGHIFWDAELWMYPPLLVLQPDMARSLLEYRFERLETAKRNAFSHGYKGAMFPWESAEEGSEETPVWALTGPFQHHITGCVGWACWKYYQVTQNKQWLQTRGYPILKEVADFWASRVERKGLGRYDINNVIGPNEWQENIDNNAFTNAIAITVLNYAAKAARELGLSPDPDWEHVAQNIPILHFPDGTTKENASYTGEEIKQVDANLLSYPLEFTTDSAQIKKDLLFYETRISSEGPAMGYAILSILHSRLGNPDKGYELFIRSYEPNKEPPFGVLSEYSQGKNPYFVTGAGGMLQTVLFGFGGIRISDHGIQQSKAILPNNWKSLKIKRKNFLHP